MEVGVDVGVGIDVDVDVGRLVGVPSPTAG